MKNYKSKSSLSKFLYLIFWFSLLSSIGVILCGHYYLFHRYISILLHPLAWFIEKYKINLMVGWKHLLIMFFIIFFELYSILTLSSLLVFYLWNKCTLGIRKKIKAFGKIAIYCFIIFLIVFAGYEFYLSKKKADLRRYHDLAYQEILNGLMSQEILKLKTADITEYYTPEEKRKSEVEWYDGSIQGRDISFAKVVVGGKEWEGMCCAVEGYAERETRYYSIQKIVDQLKIRLFFTQSDTLGFVRILSDKIYLSAHIQVLIHSSDEDHYFSFSEEKGLNQVLSVPAGYVYVHSVPPPTCTEHWDSNINFETGGQLRVITHYWKCGLSEKPEQVDYGGVTLNVEENYDNPVTQLYQWVSEKGCYRQTE